jgi:D-beta-D-heptose 7-phosphate kinase/D-beta-D-heptose 1-phosphate adenosyltransferase
MTDRNITLNKGIFGVGSNFTHRYISDYKKLKKVVSHLKGLGLKIVLTQGTYDMVHIGHARYFEEAKKHGDILIVGVDSDEKVRARKGPDRPVVPEEERLEMVTHLRPVDIVVVKPLTPVRWSLIKTVEPDVLIATKESYTARDVKELCQFCGKVVVLEPMATTTTSAKIRRLQLATAKSLGQALTPKIIDVIEDVLGNMKDRAGKKTTSSR